MAHVLMPRLGVSITEGTLTTWLKQVGDEVAEGEPICEVATDKVDTEIESTAAGILTEQLVGVDETVEVGAPLAVVVSTDEPASSAPERAQPPSIVPDPAGLGEGVAPQDAAQAEPATDNPAAHPSAVLMPRLGVSISEGTLSTWLKQVGDTVELGEPICEVATDKVDTEVESTVAGVLAEQRHAEGDVVLVGEPLAYITADGSLPTAHVAAARPTEAAPAPSTPASTQASAPVRAVARETVPGAPAQLRPGRFDHRSAVERVLGGIARSGRPAASPAARHLAATLDVDVSAIDGTGGGGHVTRDDVRRRAERPASALSRVPVVEEPPAPATVPVVVAAPSGPGGVPGGYEDVPYEAVATSRIRRVTAEHMSRSRRTAAHMTTEVDVDLGLLTDVRARLNAQRATQGLPKLTFLPFVTRAACAALLDHPDLNATFETDRLLRWRQVNVGIAVDTPRGLMVPVLRGAERMTVEALGAGIDELAKRLRDGKPDPEDFRAGTFTISNPGSVGAVSAPAIINQPQVAILGMPTIQRRPWVVTMADGSETIAIRPILRLALTFDHRAVDGADATRCLVDVRRRLEAWDVDDYR